MRKMIDIYRIVLSPEEMQRCLGFSKRSAKTQQAVEFGQKTTEARRTSEIARDNMIGKMAEVAFAKILKENYGVSVDLDFDYYPRGQWDDQDALVNDWRLDIKGTRKGGRFLLIEWNKLSFRQKYGNLSHAFVMFSVEWNREKDLPTGVVKFEGVASLSKMSRNCETTKTLRKGELIPGTKACLQADNFGIEFENLLRGKNGFDKFVDYITKNSPPLWMTRDFVNPYETA